MRRKQDLVMVGTYRFEPLVLFDELSLSYM